MLPIITLPSDNLKRPSEPVTSFDHELRMFAHAMNDLMVAQNGIGLAAPQVGRNIQLVIIKVGTEGDPFRAFVNPTITHYSKKKTAIEEGCLSIPGVFGFVERASKIRVQFYDLEGNKRSEKLTGMEAIKLQHEIDHINGILIVDRSIEYTKGKELVKRTYGVPRS